MSESAPPKTKSRQKPSRAEEVRRLAGKKSISSEPSLRVCAAS